MFPTHVGMNRKNVGNIKIVTMFPTHVGMNRIISSAKE